MPFFATPATPPRHGALAVVALTVLLAAGAAAEPLATLQISGPVGAAVRLNDKDLGLLPLAGTVALEPGVYTVTCRARGYRDLTETVILADRDSWVHLRLRPVELRRGHAIQASLLYAGLGQWYAGSRTRGWAYFLGETGGLVTALGGELQRQNKRDDYENNKARYDAALTPADVALWRARTEASYQDMKDMESLRNTGLYVAAGAWLLSLLDAWLLTPQIAVGTGMVAPSAASAGLTFAF